MRHLIAYEFPMPRLPQSGGLTLLALSAVLAVAGCHKIQDQTVANAGQPGIQDQGPDPAEVNLAPASYSTSPARQPASEKRQRQASDGSALQAKPAYTASEPPPPLPEYDQPPAPDDGYLWTPGYWAWVPTGYYWVPGAWVEPPYQGALWTPGYWGYSLGRYGFYPGHWGLHIGYYGGINYGFGYTGFGYEGGYWHAGHFNYNREYNNVDGAIVHSVYRFNAGNRTARSSPSSFNGGSGGVQIQPRPAEVSAEREPCTPRMRSQVSSELSYGFNQSQFATANGGRPANLALNLPLEADRNLRPPAPAPTGGGVSPSHARPGSIPKPGPGHPEGHSERHG